VEGVEEEGEGREEVEAIERDRTGGDGWAVNDRANTVACLLHDMIESMVADQTDSIDFACSLARFLSSSSHLSFQTRRISTRRGKDCDAK